MQQEMVTSAADIAGTSARTVVAANGGSGCCGEDVLELAEKLREVGNCRFRMGDVNGAHRDYDEVLSLLEKCVGEQLDASPAMRARLKACQIPTQLNIALCCLKLVPCQAKRALNLCDAVLVEEPDNAKASFRKAKALLELQDFVSAEAQLVHACQLAPEDRAPRKDLELVRRLHEERKQTHKQTLHEDKEDTLTEFEFEGSAGAVTEQPSGSLADALEAVALDQDDEEDPWLELETSAEEVRLATERHTELWKQVQACLAERDTWTSKLRQLKQEADATLSLESQLESSKLRGAAASTRSKQCFAQGRAYATTERRAKKLDMQVLKLLREIRALEQDPNIKIDSANNLDEAMQQAVLQDDPSKVQQLLSSLPTRLSSHRVEDIIQKRPELSVHELRSKIQEDRKSVV